MKKLAMILSILASGFLSACATNQVSSHKSSISQIQRERIPLTQQVIIGKWQFKGTFDDKNNQIDSADILANNKGVPIRIDFTRNKIFATDSDSGIFVATDYRIKDTIDTPSSMDVAGSSRNSDKKRQIQQKTLVELFGMKGAYLEKATHGATNQLELVIPHNNKFYRFIKISDTPSPN